MSYETKKYNFNDSFTLQEIAFLQDLSFAASYDATNVLLGTSIKNSIVLDGGQIQLDGDEQSPGVSHYYGTDAAGTKGMFPLPTSAAPEIYIQEVVGIQNGDDVDFDLSQLDHTPVTIYFVTKNGAMLDPDTWSVSIPTLTVLNSSAASSFQVFFSY